MFAHGSFFIADQTNDFQLDRIAQARMMTCAITNYAAHVEQMKLVAFLYRFRHVPDKTLQSPGGVRVPR